MYYDEYEANYGDGFYPLLDKESSHMKPVEISFIEYKLSNIIVIMLSPLPNINKFVSISYFS